MLPNLRLDDDLRNLVKLREMILEREKELRLLREKRNDMIVILANRGFPERVVGEHAGVAGAYVNQVKRQAKVAANVKPR